MPLENSEKTAPHDVTLDVRGMRCDNCARSLTDVLAGLEGVAEARVSYALEEALISFDPNRISADTIVDAVDSAGFEAHRRSGDAVSHANNANSAASNENTELAESEERNALRRRNRMRLGIVLSLVIMTLGMGPRMLGFPDFPGRMWIVCGLAAIVQFYVGSEFHIGAWHAARRLSTNMDTLVSLGSSVAFFYSLTVLTLELDETLFPVYFESAALIITLVLV
jgi:Cu+-exporting ATPase